MTYAVTNDCTGRSGCNNACIDVCPVACICLMSNDKVVIDPEECIHCDACRPECPANAIKSDDEASAAVLQFNATESAKGLPRG